jgi:hypothetical protein
VPSIPTYRIWINDHEITIKRHRCGREQQMTCDDPATVVQESTLLALPPAASTRPAAADCVNVETDDLGTARGIVGGCLLGLLLWMSLGLAVGLLLRS